MESLIRAGAFDGLEPSRRGMLESVEPNLKSIESDQRHNLDGQIDLFGLMSGGEEQANDYKVPPMRSFRPRSCCRWKRRSSGLYLSGHPLL